MDAAGFQEVHFPALLPRAPYEASNRWTEYGDNMFRLKDRRGNDYLLAPDPRGDVHAAREGPVLVLPRPAAGHLPDPDEVPRRGPTPGRPAARPRVRDEGLLQLRRRRRRARTCRTSATATPTSPRSSASACRSSSCRRCRGRWAARRARSSSPRSTPARTPTCAARTVTTPPTSRRCAIAAPPPQSARRPAAGGGRTTRPTRPPSPRSSTCSTPATTCAARRRAAVGARPTR